MKTLFVFLAAIFFAFFIGCQENSITDPVDSGTTEQENIFSKDLFTFTYPNVIKLDDMAYDPSHRLNSYAEISGVVRYGIQNIKKGNIFSNYGTPPDKKYKVSIYVNAELKGGCNPDSQIWTVKKSFSYIVSVNSADQSFISFEKTFRVTNTCCAPLNLVLQFQLVDQELILTSTMLKLANGLFPNRDQ